MTNNDVEGIVFNIQRFSIHDGPGIRTTVFMKGCTQRCFWCHNPEGIRFGVAVQYYADRCIACGNCVQDCPHGAHIFNEHGEHIYLTDLCESCMACVKNCFAEALIPAGEKVTVGKVMKDILLDKAFYEESGGGVTVSGGEPMAQFEFTHALLAECKKEGIHTGLETAANMPWERLEAILPVTDLVMMDIKHMDSEKHAWATGVKNELILKNAMNLMATDKPVIIHVPVIPTVNDTPEELRAIASYVKEMAEKRQKVRPGIELPSIELLTFHKLAADKYESLQMDDRAKDLEVPTRERMQSLLAAAKQGYQYTILR